MTDYTESTDAELLADARVRDLSITHGLTAEETDVLLDGLRQRSAYGPVDTERAEQVVGIFKSLSREGVSCELLMAIVTQLELNEHTSAALDAARHLGWTDQLTERLLDIDLNPAPHPWTQGWSVPPKGKGQWK